MAEVRIEFTYLYLQNTNNNAISSPGFPHFHSSNHTNVHSKQFQAQPQYAAAPLGQTPQGAQPGAGQFYAQYQQPR